MSIDRNNNRSRILSLTDCTYYANGYCMYGNGCRYRHCEKAVKQSERCSMWPKSCQNINCPYRHPATLLSARNSSVKTKEFVSFFWDIENVPIPRGQKPFDIVQRIRQKLIIEPGLQEASFACYCNINTISRANQESLQHASVRIVHVPDRKPGAADRQIMLELDRFERAHKPPATIVLISGDIDFVGKLSDLRHQVGFHVIVIHNKPAKQELKASANAHYSWELFIEPVAERPQFRAALKDQSNQAYDTNQLPFTMMKSERNRPVPLSNPYEYNAFGYHYNPRSRSRGRDRRSRSVYRKDYQYDHNQIIDTRINPNHIENIPVFPTPIIMQSETKRHRSSKRNQSKQPIVSDIKTIESKQPVVSDTKKIESKQINIKEDTQKDQSILYPCPFCKSRFNENRVLRQHQKHSKHLYFCSSCNEGFTTEIGITQHQNAKGHNDSKSTKNETNQSSNKSVTELIAHFEQKSTVSTNDKTS